MYAAAAAMNVAVYAPGHLLLDPWGWVAPSVRRHGTGEPAAAHSSMGTKQGESSCAYATGKTGLTAMHSPTPSDTVLAEVGWSDRLLRWVPMI